LNCFVAAEVKPPVSLKVIRQPLFPASPAETFQQVNPLLPFHLVT
jgi:hypothetical protein